jgi:[ribosomal protein S5]-alanine N-acetyltransferase
LKDDKTSLPSYQRAALASSGRVTLRYPSLEDQVEYVELIKASRDLHRPWEPLRPEGAPGAASQEAFTAWLMVADDQRTERMLLCRRADGAIVGRFHLNEIVHGAFCSAYMSYWVGAPFAGQGLMREGIELVLEHAFNAVNLHRVEANIQPTNAASIALAKGAGFRLEGYSERYLEIAGEWADHERWAMTVEDWRARESASDPSS